MTTTDSHEILDPDGPAAVGWFEACVAHRGPDADGICADCGWPAVDHTAGLAEVIVVARPAVQPPLRRAS